MSEYNVYHSHALFLDTACDCFRYIILLRGYKRIHLPYYICKELIDIVTKLKIKYELYHINVSLEPTELPFLEEGDAFYYINYFGLKQKYIEKLVLSYGDNLIIDNAQAFFAKPLGVDTFYSARKFYGVINGAYLYLASKADIVSLDAHYKALKLHHIPLGSKKTSKLLSKVNHNDTIIKRRELYLKLNNALGRTNLLHLPLNNEDTPMVYPYMSHDHINVKMRLCINNIYVEQFWPSVLCRCTSSDTEHFIASHMIPLFIGQNSSLEYVNRVIDVITERT